MKLIFKRLAEKQVYKGVLSHMNEIKNITIFCGAGAGQKPEYKQSALDLGKFLASHNIGVVYGGGATGMMGAVADGAISNGGYVKGIIPQFLIDREVAHDGVDEMIIVETMHERKAALEAHGDGIIMLPGGAGTLEEFFEIFTWGQLGLHEKPIGILNVAGYFDELIVLMEKLIDEGFLEARFRNLVQVETDPARLLEGFKTFKPLSTRTYEDIKDLD